MRNRRAAEIAAVITTGVAIATVSALPASASQGTPPTRWCAAVNMIVASPTFTEYFAPGTGVYVSDGMDIAMNRLGQDNPGYQNMFDAVAVSTSHAQSPNCTS
jgi:hypothetical protein